MNRPCILIVEEGPKATWRTGELLEGSNCAIETVNSFASACRRLRSTPVPQVVLLNIHSADATGLLSITNLRSIRPYIKVIVLLPCGHADQVVKAVRSGADTCVWKPCDSATLLRVLAECLTVGGAPASLQGTDSTEELEDGAFFVMASPAMRKLRAQVDQVAPIDVPVLCLGESGTGKEVIARLIHAQSPRAQRPFLKVNCAAMPGELLESELFGYERGAFTGAVRSKPGKFELCNHGSLLLDEIAEMPPALQAKLLHVLQDQEFTRLGGCTPVKVSVRVLAATNMNIRDGMLAKTFREDLYYRLSTFVFSLPALRDRREDLPILIQRYLSLYASRLSVPEREMPPHVWDLCLRYDWPGNVRELENFVKRYLICGEEAINFTNSDSPSVTEDPGESPDRSVPALADLKSHVRGVRSDAEISVISRALEQTKWNRKEAAGMLSISYKSLLSKIRLYGLDKASDETVLSSAGFAVNEDKNKPLFRVQSFGTPS